MNKMASVRTLSRLELRIQIINTIYNNRITDSTLFTSAILQIKQTALETLL